MAAAAILSVLAWAGSARAEAIFLDGLVAEVDGVVVTASDVALGRALGLFGLTPSSGPLSAGDIQRYIDGQLLAREASRIGVESTPAERAEAWAAVVQRGGGESILTRWLTIADVEEAWARRLVVDDLRMRQFIELRFLALAFVAEADLAAALGPGDHDEGAREAMRERLEAEAADRRLAEWLADPRGAPGSVHASSRSARSPIRCPLPGVGAPLTSPQSGGHDFSRARGDRSFCGGSGSRGSGVA